MTQDLKEQIAKNAASGWCRCFKCDGVFDDTNIKCEKEKLVTCQQWYNGYRTALLALGDERVFENLWKPADGDDLPEIDREVIALVEENEHYKVVFAHRPPEYWDGKNILTGKVTRYKPKRYDKGGWNLPDVKWWLDCDVNELLCREK